MSAPTIPSLPLTWSPGRSPHSRTKKRAKEGKTKRILFMMPSLIVFQLGYSHDPTPGVQKISMKQIYSIILFVSGFRGGKKNN
jgi:preprotein translocase subunit SecY